MRISDWSSDVCSSDLDVAPRRLDPAAEDGAGKDQAVGPAVGRVMQQLRDAIARLRALRPTAGEVEIEGFVEQAHRLRLRPDFGEGIGDCRGRDRHRRHDPDTRDRKSTRLNQSLMRISYAVFCLKK